MLKYGIKNTRLVAKFQMKAIRRMKSIEVRLHKYYRLLLRNLDGALRVNIQTHGARFPIRAKSLIRAGPRTGGRRDDAAILIIFLRPSIFQHHKIYPKTTKTLLRHSP